MSSPNLDELTENFLLFDDWEARYQYLIDLGQKVPHMSEELKTDASLVRGCVSRVWLLAQTDDADKYHFQIDSDAHIVRGLIAIVLMAYDDKTAAEIRDTKIRDIFEKIGLDQHLSPNRRNGFFAMVERIQAITV